MFSRYREKKNDFSSLNSLSSSNSFDLTKDKSTEEVFLNDIISINKELLINKNMQHNLVKDEDPIPATSQSKLNLKQKQKSIMSKLYKSNLRLLQSLRARKRVTKNKPDKFNKTTQTDENFSMILDVEKKIPTPTQLDNNISNLKNKNFQINLNWDESYELLKFVIKQLYFIYSIYSLYDFFFGLLKI